MKTRKVNLARAFLSLFGGVLLLMLAAALVRADQTVLDEPIVSETSLSYNNTYSRNLAKYGVDSLSFQAVYTSATVPSKTFQDGTESTGSITAAKTTGLVAAAAANYMTVVSTTGLLGKTLIINSYHLQEGVHFSAVSTTTGTAVAILNAITTFVPDVVASTGAASVVFTTAAVSGTAGNAYTMSCSSPAALTVSSPVFTGGVNNAVISINGVSLTQGTDWTAVATTTGIAKAISDAIVANSSLSAVISSTWTSSVVFTTATAVGTATNYAMTSSTNASLSLSGSVTVTSGAGVSAMTGGTDANYTINTPTITIASHGFNLALPVLYSTGSVAIGGLTNQTTYYAIPITANTLKLASSSANAQAGTAISITSSSTQTTAHTYTLAPLAVSGTPSFKFQVSNDGANWTDFATTVDNVAISSVTVSSYTYGGTTGAWDLGRMCWKWIRVNVIAPTQGGLALTVNAFGKRN